MVAFGSRRWPSSRSRVAKPDTFDPRSILTHAGHLTQKVTERGIRKMLPAIPRGLAVSERHSNRTPPTRVEGIDAAKP